MLFFFCQLILYDNHKYTLCLRESKEFPTRTDPLLEGFKPTTFSVVLSRVYHHGFLGDTSAIHFPYEFSRHFLMYFYWISSGALSEISSKTLSISFLPKEKFLQEFRPVTSSFMLWWNSFRNFYLKIIVRNSFEDFFLFKELAYKI